MAPRLTKSYKNRYPFRLGTTSFIYPRGYAANVALLGPWLDEIELLFFESRPDSWPSAEETEKLIELAETHSLCYNIHLPLDLHLGHAAAHIRGASVETLIDLFRRTAPLKPTTWTLHLLLDADPGDRRSIADWRQRVSDSLRKLSDGGISPASVSLENLDYPIEWIHEISERTGFRMCLDVGHLLLNRVNVPAVYDRYEDSIDVIHLHGVRAGKDHLSLAALPETSCRWIPQRLAGFSGSLSLEVFSCDSLLSSLAFFEQLWDQTA